MWSWQTFLFRYELVQLLLSYGAEVNCYFRVICNTVFPTALQYCLRDHVMLKLLLNSGYQAHKYVWKTKSVNIFHSCETEQVGILTSNLCNLVPGRCFQCCHGDSKEIDYTWTDLHNQAYRIYSQPHVISVRANTARYMQYTHTHTQ